VTSLLAALQVQASAWSRWRFGDKQAKPSEVQTSGAEIFIMLPLGVIAVGELSEGEEVSFIHQCVWHGSVSIAKRCTKPRVSSSISYAQMLSILECCTASLSSC